MKNIKTAKALSEIDEEFIIEALPKDRIKVTVFPWKYIALASSFALIVCLGVMAVLFSGGVESDKAKANSSTSEIDDTGYEKRIIRQDDSSHADIAKEKSWAEKNNSERFAQLEGLTEFVSTNTIVPKDKVDITPLDPNNTYTDTKATDLATGKTYTIGYRYCLIKGINYNYAIAVNFKGEDKFYAYVNTNIKPYSFMEFAKCLDLENNISFGSAYYTLNDGREIQFEGLDTKKVWEILFSDQSSMTAMADPDKLLTQDGFKKRVSISTSIDLLGYKNLTMSFSDDGMLFTNLLGTAKIFRIDAKNVQRLKSYLTSSCRGYELIYEGRQQGESEKANEQKGSSDSSSVSKLFDENDVSKKYTVLFINDNYPVYRATGSTVTLKELESTGVITRSSLFTEQFHQKHPTLESKYNNIDDEEYFTNSISGNVASFKSITSHCAFAVQYVNRSGAIIDDKWYVFAAEDYEPNTLYGYANDIGIKHYATYTNKSQKPLAADKVWDVIFDDGEKNVIESDTSKYDDSKKVAEINIDISVLGCKGKSIKVSEDGYLYADVFGKPKVFNIGKEKAQKIADFLNE